MAINPADDTQSFGATPPQPFRLLGIDPGATVPEVDAALKRASQMHVAPEEALVEAHADILEPARRLPNELSYPLGSTADDVDLFFAELPADASDRDILQASARLAPLPRANFIARHASRRGASDELLVGLIGAHDAIDVMEIYHVLLALRYRALWPPPSLASVSDALNELLTTHCNAVIGAYDPVEAAARPLLQSTHRILATHQHSLVETQSVLLAAYRRTTGEVRALADRQADEACRAIQQQPDDASAIEQLTAALQRWTSLCEPLLLLDAVEGRNAAEMNVTPDRLFDLLGDLSRRQLYFTAQQVLDRGLDAFQSIPDVTARLTTVGEILREMQRVETSKIDTSNTDSAGDVAAPAPRRGFRRKAAVLGVLALLSVTGIVASYLIFNDAAPLSVVSTPDPVQSKAAPELLPPVGRGQRLAREHLRYCRYQEERLRVVKQWVRGPEDVRAYNALANDYNGRCSDFFYQDEDLRVVKEEVVAMQKLLEADAGRIVSAWPWRANGGTTSATK